MSPSLVYEQPRVLIIGAGLSGLVLAHGLRMQGIDFSIFERDPTTDYRPQGYRAKIPGFVVDDMRSVLPSHLRDEFEATCAETVEGETHLNAVNGIITARRARMPQPPNGMKIYTADRAALRKLLMTGLENDIHFGKGFTKLERNKGRVIAHFSDETSEEGTLLVGADGAWSKVRRETFPEHEIYDTGCSCIYGKTPLTPEVVEQLSPKVLKGLTLSIDPTPPIQEIITGDMPVAFMMEPIRFPGRGSYPDLPADYLYWGISFRNQLFAPTPKQFSQFIKKPAKSLSLFISREWDPTVRSVLELQDPSTTLATKIFSASPELPAWNTIPGVTFVGDSVHLMSSAGGVGAVTAIRNAVALSRTLGTTGFSSESIAIYENDMREFAKVNIQRGFLGGEKMFKQRPFEACEKVETKLET